MIHFEFLERFIQRDYFGLRDDVKEFSQRILFLEYLDEWDHLIYTGQTEHSLYTIILADMYILLHREEYETVQLYKDTLERYRIDIEIINE